MSGLPPFVSRDVTLTIYDGAASPKSASFGNGSGLFDIPGLDAGNFEVVEVKNRQQHLALLKGESKTYEFSTEITVADVADLTNASAHRILDAIRKTGDWASATSVETIGCGVWAVKVVISMSNTCGASATITLPKCRLTGDLSMTEEGLRLTVNGTCYESPTIA
jgi:hypothetical protein